MTEQEILNNLTTKFWQVGTPTKYTTYANVELWKVPVIKKVGNVAWDNVAYYWRVNENECYWKNGEIESTTGFLNELRTYIQAKITDGTIESATIQSSDFDNETAIVSVVLPNLSEKRLLIDRNSSGDIQYRILV